MRDAFIAELTTMAAEDSSVTLLTGDLGFKVFDDFAAKFPRQFLNVGVAEQNMTGIAAGLALDGRKVFTYSIANFPILRCLEQIRNDAAYHEANVNVVSIGGGFSYGALGMSHHATEDLAIMRAIPELTVVAPSDDWETRAATRALAALPSTTYLRLDRASTAGPTGPAEVFALGRGRILAEGSELAIVACGSIVGEALRAAETLRTVGVSASVVSLHTLQPIDRELLNTVAKSHTAMLTVEEHVLNGGLGGAVAEVLADSGSVPRRFRRLGLPPKFVTAVGSQEYLRTLAAIDASGITAAARELLRSR